MVVIIGLERLAKNEIEIQKCATSTRRQVVGFICVGVSIPVYIYNFPHIKKYTRGYIFIFHFRAFMVPMIIVKVVMFPINVFLTSSTSNGFLNAIYESNFSSSQIQCHI